MTFADLERIPDSEGRFELRHGELISLPPAKHVLEIFDKEQTCLEDGGCEFRVVDPVRLQVKVPTPDGHFDTYKIGQAIPLLSGGTRRGLDFRLIY